MHAYPAQYDSVAKSLHWLMAFLIIALWCVGVVAEEMPRGDLRSQIVGMHRAFGVVALALVLLRTAWRATHPAPELPNSMPAIERLAAKLGHLALYGLMIAIPIDGILMSQYGGREINVFGFILPILVEKNDALKAVFKEGHEVLGWTLAVVLAAHVGASLRHHFLLKDGIMARMLPGRG